jgi:hypothetical protein
MPVASFRNIAESLRPSRVAPHWFAAAIDSGGGAVHPPCQAAFHLGGDVAVNGVSAQGGKVWAWLFEAKGIQRYLFASGRLRDAVGASDLVARIAASDGNDLIGEVLRDARLEVAAGHSPPQGQLAFSRRAGGAFCLHGARGDLVRARAAFRRRLMPALPGLEISDALGEGDDWKEARDRAYASPPPLRANTLADVRPHGRPVVAVAPLSGLPQVGEARYRGRDGGEDIVALDAVTAPQRAHADVLRLWMGQPATEWQTDGAARRFHPPAVNIPMAYPRNLGDEVDEPGNPLFPWRNCEDRRIAMVHADISGLGEAFAQAGPGQPGEALALGQKIEQAIVGAVQAANHQSILPGAEERSQYRDHPGARVAPARPLVIGGDDITVLVRADLALPFAVKLLEAIEKRTRHIAGGLSACAGVAIAHRGLPFLAASSLAESLVKFAKARAKRTADGNPAQRPYPSLLAFHLHNQTAQEDYGDDIRPHLDAGAYGALTGNPYAIGDAGTRASSSTTWSQLMALAKAIAALEGAFGTLRTLKGHLADGREEQAQGLWRRFLSRGDRADTLPLATFLEALRPCVVGDLTPDEVPLAPAMFDALVLIDIGAVAAPDREAESLPQKAA